MQEYEIDDLIDLRYKVLNKIGGGGFGKVVEVIDITNQKNKILKYCFSENGDDIRRFQREVRIMNDLQHENVIEIIDSNTSHTPPYFTMPKAQCSVSDIIETELKGNLHATIMVFNQICAGLTIIHSSGHTHRDIKPENALYFPESRIVVSDLGLAKRNLRNSTVVTQTHMSIGTEGFAPPEIYTPGGTRDMDHLGDIYMLGKTLYVLYTNLNPILVNPQSVPQGLLLIIQKATRYKPEERYQSVGELLDALHDFQRALDPNMDPISLFKDLLSSHTDDIFSTEYNPDNIQKMLRTIYIVDDEETYLNLFHEIPLAILKIFASDYPNEFEPIMGKYRASVINNVGNQFFSFADTVSARMALIFRDTKSLQIKQDAIISLLKAAVSLNRFAAMDMFDTLLQEVKEEDDAFAVAASLRDELNLYGYLYHRIQMKSLHPALQIVWEISEKNEKEKKILNDY